MSRLESGGCHSSLPLTAGAGIRGAKDPEHVALSLCYNHMLYFPLLSVHTRINIKTMDYWYHIHSVGNSADVNQPGPVHGGGGGGIAL